VDARARTGYELVSRAALGVSAIYGYTVRMNIYNWVAGFKCYFWPLCEIAWTCSPVLIDLEFDASVDFHRYAIEWNPSGIRCFVDGELVFTRTGRNGGRTDLIISSGPVLLHRHDSGCDWLGLISKSVLY
jgi:hypothetical protein